MSTAVAWAWLLLNFAAFWQAKNVLPQQFPTLWGRLPYIFCPKLNTSNAPVACQRTRPKAPHRYASKPSARSVARMPVICSLRFAFFRPKQALSVSASAPVVASSFRTAATWAGKSAGQLRATAGAALSGVASSSPGRWIWLCRVTPSEKGPVLACAVITWPHPSQPKLRWVTARRLDVGATDAEIQAARRALLDDPRWFAKCTHCKEWNATGHMHEQGFCQGCAQDLLGVVY